MDMGHSWGAVTNGNAVKRTPLARKFPMNRGGRVKPVNRGRKAKNHERAFGGEDRLAFVQSLGCVAIEGGRQCLVSPSENCHVRNGGMSRKADAKDTIPMCKRHHRLQHAKGWEAVGLGGEMRFYVAEAVEKLWAARGGDAEGE